MADQWGWMRADCRSRVSQQCKKRPVEPTKVLKYGCKGKSVLKLPDVLSDLQALFHRTSKIAMLPKNTLKGSAHVGEGVASEPRGCSHPEQASCSWRAASAPAGASAPGAPSGLSRPPGFPTGSGGQRRGPSEAAVGPRWAPGGSGGRGGPRNPAAGDWIPPLQRQRSCSREHQLKVNVLEGPSILLIINAWAWSSSLQNLPERDARRISKHQGGRGHKLGCEIATSYALKNNKTMFLITKENMACFNR
ncbi:uncharacterized protein LOC109491206 [Ailuropoda melanoleuca]|uniref:uncharacterized protein LOC109491206 n=1 Tax=Ailuropoda melanoleuca TaxID=9646 RepID=UPI001493EE63|nr:uncharacterized protein LOC109491206 [Ailuropoda melanoleuca]